MGTLPATMTVAKFDVLKFYMGECTGTTFTVHPGADEAAAKAATGVKVPYTAKDGKVACTGWAAADKTPTNWFTMTASGWVVKKADDTKKDETTTGATSMAAAFAAGALAVAATQF